MANALLISNSTNHGAGFLDHVRTEIVAFLDGIDQIVFFPYALADHDGYTKLVSDALAGVCTVLGAQSLPSAKVRSAPAYFMGGGNSFRLLQRLHGEGLIEALRRRVLDEDVRYIGSSAGTNMACPTLRTTNDMPIVQPPSFAALGIVPFQINPHYIDVADTPTHMGETRETRLVEFTEENDVPVVGLREGAWLTLSGPELHLGGSRGARLFRRNREPVDKTTGDRLDDLLDGRSYRFDV